LRLLQRLNGIYILLGAGDWAYERFFSDMSAGFENFIFLNGYSETCAEALYANGDLFLMPSSFEPCGISQMLAMRDGQPCVVHHVGGLKDTVRHNDNGFAFTGDSLARRRTISSAPWHTALTMHKEAAGAVGKICRQAETNGFPGKKHGSIHGNPLPETIALCRRGTGIGSNPVETRPDQILRLGTESRNRGRSSGCAR
jgi:starch synthase